MSNPKVKIPIMLSRWRVEYKGAYGRWEDQRHFPSRGAAVAFAQERRDEDPSTLTDWRVVDTQPDAEDERAPIVVHSCDDQAHVFVPHNLRLYDYVPGVGPIAANSLVRERSRPEPKPWHLAKVAEIWALTIDGVTKPYLVTIDADFVLRFTPPLTRLTGRYPLDFDRITAGRRIWSEGDES